MNTHFSSYYCVCSFLVMLLGCEQSIEQINSAPHQAPPPSIQPEQSQPAKAPQPVAEASFQAPEPKKSIPIEPMAPPKKSLAPKFAGSIKRLITPKILNGKQGATFSLVTALRGDELQRYSYQIEIRDQSGSSISLPLEYSDGNVTLNEFIPAAGVRERYDYRIMYLDPDTNEYIPLRQDNWAYFNVEDD